MNITHAVTEKVNCDKLEAIFNRQKELMSKYHDIELRSGLMQTEDCPVNLDDKKGQARIKDFSWRITEEVGEALDAHFHEDGELAQTHFVEEMIDGLHFLTEMTILSGWDDKNFDNEDIFEDKMDKLEYLVKNNQKKENDKLETIVCELVNNLGMMCNCLKNKPWKQTQMKTNRENFYTHLRLVWNTYFKLLTFYDYDADFICDIYLKKSQVNKFRQRSNY